MRFPLAFPMPVRAPDGDGGGGGATQQQTGGDTGQQTTQQTTTAATTTADTGGKPAATGLLDLAEKPQGTEQTEQTTTTQTEVPGKLTFKARPDWLPEPFFDAKTGEVKLEALAKSQADLRAAVSKGANKPPAKADDYKLEMEPAALDSLKGLFQDGDPGKDPLMAAARAAAHEAGLSQAAFNGFMAKVLPELAKVQPAPFDAAAELKALDPNPENAKKIVTAMAAKGQALVEQGVLTKDDLSEFAVMVGTAAGMKVMQKIFEYHGEQPISVDLVQTAANGPSADGLRGELAEIMKMPEGPEKQRRADAWQAKQDRLYGNAPAGRAII